MFLRKTAYIILFLISLAKSREIFKTEHGWRGKDNIRLSRATFKYNHSPSLSIPVSIVFDEGENRAEKSIDLNVSTPTHGNVSLKNEANISKSEALDGDKIISSVTTKDDAIKITIPVQSTTNNNKNKPRVDKSTGELQIPVAVIYDKEIDVSFNPKIASKNKTIASSIRTLNSRHMEYDTATTEFPVMSEKEVTATQTHRKPLSTKSETDSKSKPHKRTRERDPVIPIIQSENQVFAHNGNFRYSYESGDGTIAFERGELKSIDDDKNGEAVVGGFSYTAKDGQEYSLSYTADENGYRPVGAHLPTPPPIPPAIARALRYLATKSTPNPVTEPQ